jgi:hypothetical protein
MGDRFEIRSRLSVDEHDGEDPRIQARARHDGWEIESLWSVSSGRPEPIEVRISGDHGIAKSITAEAIRRLPLGEILAESRQELGALARTVRKIKAHGVADDVPDDVLDSLDVRGKPQRGQALTDADLAEVANIYRAAWTEGRPVNEAVRSALFLSKDGAAKRIMRARKAGLLEGMGPKR